MNPNFINESKYWKEGYDIVVGIDEVGRGAFAGPLVAAGVVYRKDSSKTGLGKIKDSKLLSAKQREALSSVIKEKAIYTTIEEIDVSVINEVGVGKANNIIFERIIGRVISEFPRKKIFCLIDGLLPKNISSSLGIINGDQLSISIASASIIAKVHRDALMDKMSRDYQEYDFEQNKGYGTKSHQDAIRSFGLCQEHRKSFDLKAFLSARPAGVEPAT